ncbi:MAG: XdhC/CoxI family protein [Candidatus Aureabacteria bacterium]|nr:XdhC/CoxI family protein [Candidatus Auribacterota bacterium]
MWLKSLNEWKEEGIPCAALTIIEAEGPTPRGVGSKMVVNNRGDSAGSIGGGPVEHISLDEARKAFKDNKCRTLKFSLKGDEWQVTKDKKIKAICGGTLSVFIEPIMPREEVVIFGAGHIGEKLAKLCAILNLPCRVYDNRKEYLTAERFPDAKELICGEYRALAEKVVLTPMSYCVVLTHGHAHDEECLELLLQNRDIPYIGMIGSPEKVGILVKNIRSRGTVVDGRLYSPVGLKIGRNLPEEIALSIITEIMLLAQGGSGEHYRIKWHELK